MKFASLFVFLFMISFHTKAQIKVGEPAPHFSLTDQNGNVFNLENEIGNKNLVVYFYPKDDTPGCTKEACTFRDQYKEFENLDAMVIGISSDSENSHDEFAQKFNLPFTLLADVDGKVRELYKVASDLFGLIPGRVTFVIDKEGIVRYVFNSQLNTEKHVTGSLEALKALEK